MNELALFAGAGGGILGSHLLGWRTVCAVEQDNYARRVLLARQRDGILPRFPIWDDVSTFQGAPWKGRIQVLTGGFPCQDVSLGGSGKGLDGKKSGLWSEMARIIGEVLPRFVFIENSPQLTARGLKRVLWELASLGYDARWGVLGAYQAGAPHRRNRIWIVACRQSTHEIPTVPVPDPDSTGLKAQRSGVTKNQDRDKEVQVAEWNAWWRSEPDVDRVADDVANRAHRLKALGNGQVPAVAAMAWRILAAPFI